MNRRAYDMIGEQRRSCDIRLIPSSRQDVGYVVEIDSYNGQHLGTSPRSPDHLRIFYVYNATTGYCYRVTVGLQIEDQILNELIIKHANSCEF